MLSELDLYKLDMYERQVLRKCYLKEGEEKGLKEGEEGIKRIIRNILENGYSLEETSRLTGLSVDYINKICGC